MTRQYYYPLNITIIISAKNVFGTIPQSGHSIECITGSSEVPSYKLFTPHARQGMTSIRWKLLFVYLPNYTNYSHLFPIQSQPGAPKQQTTSSTHLFAINQQLEPCELCCAETTFVLDPMAVPIG